VHRALHDIGEKCSASAEDVKRPDVGSSVRVILGFARKYPEGRFPIDDETGSALSLLLVTKDELDTCSPRHAARVARELPPDLRNLDETG